MKLRPIKVAPRQLCSVIACAGWVLSQSAFASSSCSVPPKSASEVLKCALENHPEILRQRSLLKQGETLVDVANRLPNPELDSKFTYGDSFGESVYNSETTIAQPFELGGKRSARVLKAQAQRLGLAADALSAQEQIAIDVVTNLHKLRHYLEESKALEEGLETYERIVRQYRSRPRLSPEQQVSLAVFQLAASDSRLKKANLEGDIKEIVRSLSFATGQPINLENGILPSSLPKWSEALTPPTLAGSEILKAKAELAVSGAELTVAQSESWPDLKLGPVLGTQSQGKDQFATIGLSFAMPLPIFNTNAAGRAYARQGVETASRKLEVVNQKAKADRDNLLVHYRNAVDSLKASAGAGEIEKKHQNIEALFNRGVVSSSLLIESHRQILEFIKSRQEQELTAIEALWKIYALDGRVTEEQP